MPSFRGAVRVLVFLSVGAFIAQLVLGNFIHWPVNTVFGLVPAAMAQGWLWQPFTYAFLHDGVFHLLFNMLILWSLGSELELNWGTKSFVAYYFVCAFGAALFYAALCLMGIGFSANIPLIGASGAIYGLLMAYGILYGDRTMYFFMVFPLPAKYFVLILGAVELVSSIFYGQNGVAHTAHLGGMASGFLYLFAMASWRKRSKVEFREEQEARERKKRLQKKAGHLKLIPGRDDSEDPKQWH